LTIQEIQRGAAVPKTTPRQRKTTGRVMHEFKHGELRSGLQGKGGKVTSRRQAIAIALSEAGASKYQSKRENRRRLTRTEAKEARGETYQQEREGKSHIGVRGRRESSPTKTTRRLSGGRRKATLTSNTRSKSSHASHQS
jgi:hypothetical protein